MGKPVPPARQPAEPRPSGSAFPGEIGQPGRLVYPHAGAEVGVPFAIADLNAVNANMMQRWVGATTDGGRWATAIAQFVESQRYGRSALSVGLDVVSVAEVTAALDRFGERYVQRVYTPREAAYCLGGTAAVGARRFAARFAAKEAAVKALAPSSRWTDWRAIEVRRQPSGACALVLQGEAASLAAQRGIDHLALSMSHDGDLAIACVVALRTPLSTNASSLEQRHV